MNRSSPIAHPAWRPASRPLLTLLILAASLASIAVPAPGARAADPAADAAKVLDRFIEATGGKAVHDAIRNSVSHMTLTLPAQEVSFTMTVYAARPNLVYTVLESPLTGKIETGVSGDVVWDLSTTTGPRLREGQEREDGLRDATFDAMARWRDLYPQVELSGTDSVGGSLCDKVLLTPGTGRPRTVYFDRASGLLKRLDVTIDSPGGAAPMRMLQDDYRMVGGILVPHRTEVEVLGQKRIMAVDSLRQNLEMPADRFEPPAEVKKLIEAKSSPGAAPR